MNDHDDEPTSEVLAMTDAELLAAVRAQRRLEDDMLRAVHAAFEPRDDNEPEETP